MSARIQQTTGSQTYDKLDGRSDSSLKIEYGCMNYMIGKVVSVSKTSIVLENNYLGYTIRVANSSDFEINKVKKLYVLKIAKFHNNFINETIYGFHSIEAKEAFLANGYKFTEVAKSVPKSASKTESLIKALKSLGYSQSEIDYSTSRIFENEVNAVVYDLSDLISLAIRHIANKEVY